MRVTFLGTGTSVGVPALTCRCAVCTSDDPRNNRLRAGLLLDWEDGGAAVRVLVDTTTDLRQQALRAGLRSLDAVLFTHHHADHVLGIDELRLYNFVQGAPLALYGRRETLAAVSRMFAYAFESTIHGAPRLQQHIAEERFTLRGVDIIPVPVRHAELTISAYRIGDFAYVTDCNAIPESSVELLRGVKTLVLPALRRTPHRAHFTLDEVLAEIDRLAPERTFLTHLSHEFDHQSLDDELPANVAVAYDGLRLEVDESAS